MNDHRWTVLNTAYDNDRTQRKKIIGAIGSCYADTSFREEMVRAFVDETFELTPRVVEASAESKMYAVSDQLRKWGLVDIDNPLISSEAEDRQTVFLTGRARRWSV